MGGIRHNIFICVGFLYCVTNSGKITQYFKPWNISEYQWNFIKLLIENNLTTEQKSTYIMFYLCNLSKMLKKILFQYNRIFFITCRYINIESIYHKLIFLNYVLSILIKVLLQMHWNLQLSEWIYRFAAVASLNYKQR